MCVQFCKAKDSKEIAVDDNFYNEGDAIKGSDDGVMTAGYGDIGEPSLHPDCRCYIRPEEISID
jgi:hypothetical protein